MSERAADLSLVVPCHNEEPVVMHTARLLLQLLDEQRAAGRCGARSLVLFVDDGSTDATWTLIEQLAHAHPGYIAGLRLSRNVGHQNALLAGLTLAPGDVLISLDADLQDDLEVIPQMLDYYRNGHDIVYGVRAQRATDTRMKRLTAAAFYRLLRRLGVDVIDNHADFRLMSRRAIEMLRQYGEVNLFLRGIVRLIGLPSAQVYYQRRERVAGSTKYPWSRMSALAMDGITSFSVVPLRVISMLGLLTSVFALAVSIWVVFVALTKPSAVPGWASTVLPITFIGGVQILSIGVLGEYIGKIYMETKRRPRFIVERAIGLPVPVLEP
ncbi:MAG TPA: glycosyltransferase family 2 protein [Steroidobacteraceae bacterium]|jgi:glycosyltransferase involved in cell wall biosynthesis